MTSFNARRVRADIPQLTRRVHGRPLTYLDSGASSLQPNAVIDAMSRYYELRHANVHRGVYTTAVEATDAYEASRAAVARFINAPGGENEIVFTKNTTESINLLAKVWGAAHLGEGDAVLITEMEHHANIVPWFQLREATGVEVRFIPVGDDYRLDLTNLDELLSDVKLLSITGMSNVLGTKNNVHHLAAAAHSVGALVAVDGAQSVAHGPVDVERPGHRLSRLLRAQDARTDGHWRALDARERSRHDGPLHGRRRHDRRRAPRWIHPGEGRLSLRGGHSPRSLKRWVCTPPCATSRDWAWTMSPPTSAT